MSSNAPTMQQTMVMIKFLRLLECWGGAAAAEDAAGAGCVGVADAAVGDDVDEEDNEDEEDDDGVAVCCETAELITPTAETAFPIHASREFVVAACAMTAAAWDKAQASERRCWRCMLRFQRLHVQRGRREMIQLQVDEQD